MNKLDELNIFAYFSPDPFDEDFEMEEEFINWLPGYKQGETEDGWPSYYAEENVALFNKIELVIIDHFKEGAKRLWPMLSKVYFKEIHIAINYSINNNAIAGYKYAISTPSTGTYYFSVDISFLNLYCKLLNKEVDSLPKVNVWEHELIHLLDHWSIVQASAFSDSSEKINTLAYYQLKYREEGVANLLELMDGHISTISCIEEARNTFIQNYNATQEQANNMSAMGYKEKQDIFNGYDFYTVGPWLVLDYLKNSLNLLFNIKSSIEVR